jgi:hypothetical protein
MLYLFKEEFMPHREGYPGRRDGFIGHRDGTPDDPLALLRQARRILIKSTINAERWNIPPFAIDAYKIGYMNAREIFAEFENIPPPEPDPIDGFTIYWDKKRRFNELLCAFHNIEIDKDGRFDIVEMSRRMLASDSNEHFGQWREFLLNIVKENAVRYKLPQEWVEAVRRRMYETPSPKPDDGSMQQTFFLLYLQN